MESINHQHDTLGSKTLFYKTNKRSLEQLKSDRGMRYENYSQSRQNSRNSSVENFGFKTTSGYYPNQPKFEGMMNRRKLLQLWSKFSSQPIADYLKVNSKQEIGHTFKISRADLKLKFDGATKTHYDRVFSESPKRTKFENYWLRLVEQKKESQLMK